MFNSPVLDLVILLSFTYFIGGILLSAINEALLGRFARKNQLKNGIETMFFEADWLPFVQKHFNLSPHIESLMENKGRYPAYIPATNFVHAITENLDKAALAAGKIQSCLEEDGKPILPAAITQVLKNILQDVQSLPQKEEAFQKRMEAFFNNSMDRVGGWYKKKIRRVLLVLGIILSIIMNLDTIKIINDSLSNKKNLGEQVDKIMASMANIQKDGTNIIIKNDKGEVLLSQYTKLDTLSANAQMTIDSTTGKPATQPVDTKEKIKTIQVVLQENTGLGYGYANLHEAKVQWLGKKSWTWEAFRTFLLKAVGIILTAFALQLGSNFWFDILNKAGNLRSVGKKPVENSTPPKS